MEFSVEQRSGNNWPNHRFKEACRRRKPPGRSQPRCRDNVTVRQGTILRKSPAVSQVNLIRDNHSAAIEALLKFLAFGLPLLTLFSAAIQAAF